MDSPTRITEAQSLPRRRVSMDSNSPEFEFWMTRNPSLPNPNLISADELFADGVLLPLHLRDPAPEPDPDDPDPTPEPESDTGPKITSSSSLTSLSPSKRWRDIFKKDKDKDKEKEKKSEKKERKTGNGSTASSAELNINIWPFSRSRSAGNACTRPKPVFGAPTGSGRKANSAPCSRSNSAGESKSRKWPSSPGRPGVHLGRSSPVWQVRRGAPAKDPTDIRRSKLSVANGAPAKAKAVNLNVPTCIGYRNQLSCRSDDNGVPVAGAGKCHAGTGRGVGTVGSGNLFNFRGLFAKKVY